MLLSPETEGSITVTTTATLRPEILDKTYASFTKNIQNARLRNFKLVINVDPAPKSRVHEVAEVVAVANRYFDCVEVFTPSEANFTSAIKRLWGAVSTDFIFHIEDDWELIKPVNFFSLFSLFDDEYTQQVKLCGTVANRVSKLGLSPSITRATLFREAAKNMSDLLNPETQLHTVTKHVNRKQIVIYPTKRIQVVRDIGRAWMKENNILRKGKNDAKNKFTTWLSEQE